MTIAEKERVAVARREYALETLEVDHEDFVDAETTEAPTGCAGKCCKMFKDNLFMFLILLGVAIGFGLGFGLRAATTSSVATDWISKWSFNFMSAS